MHGPIARRAKGVRVFVSFLSSLDVSGSSDNKYPTTCACFCISFGIHASIFRAEGVVGCRLRLIRAHLDGFENLARTRHSWP